MLIPNLRHFRREYPPLRTSGDRVTYEGIFYDENWNARNVGLILMMVSGPIDARVVDAIGSRGDRDFLTRLPREGGRQALAVRAGPGPLRLRRRQRPAAMRIDRRLVSPAGFEPATY